MSVGNSSDPGYRASLGRTYRPVVLMILDGWGQAPAQAPEAALNAIVAASTPNLTRLGRECPTSLLGASGNDVGLKDGQMGDSNVGHLNLGAGRIVYQDVVRIDQAVADGTLGELPVLRDLLGHAARTGHTLHLMGLLSDGGVHSHQQHLTAIINAAAAAGVSAVRVHAFLDGRDVPPRSAATYLAQLDQDLAAASVFPGPGLGNRDYRLATISGRYYAMDRDNRWDRTAAAYGVITGVTDHAAAPSWQAALADAYARGESDEFVRPITVGAGDRMVDGDAVFFFNFRADRGRQLTVAFTAPSDSLPEPLRQHRRPTVRFASMTQYDARQGVPAVFGPLPMNNTLGEVVSSAGLRQLRLAETEKYAHVTFFFSGGREEPFAGEDRILVPSPKVATYDQQPEMAAPEITRQAIQAIESGKYDLIIMNYANGDMVGHTGDFTAAVRAVETVDRLLAQVVATATMSGGAVLIVSDHGNCEEMYDRAQACPHTAHTNNPVPVILCAGALPESTRLQRGVLADVAPTILQLMGLAAPPEMRGTSLIVDPE